MIVKGGARGGAGNLATHLEKDTNERVSVVAINGLAATTIKEALAEIMAQTVGTACRDGMYHAAISPRPGELDMTPEQRLHAVDVVAEELGLAGQPRIVVEHHKIGASGIERTHTHVVFSRVDEDGKTISDFNNYPAHERAARRLEIELGHEPTPGVWSREEGTPRPPRTPHQSEYQQAERSRIDPKDAERLLTDLWVQSDSGKGFVAAAAERGFAVCEGDKCLLVVDPSGDHVRLSRRLPDRAADIKARMAGLELPKLDEVLQTQSQRQVSPGPEIAQEAPSNGQAIEGCGELAPPSAALADGQRAPIFDVTESVLSVGDELAATPAHEAATSEQAVSAFEDYRSTGDDRFTDEKPTPAVEHSAAAGVDKAASTAMGMGGKVVGMIAQAVTKAFEGVLDFFFSGGPPTPAPSKEQAPQRESQPAPTPQRAARTPEAQPIQQRPEPQPEKRPSESFLAAMTQRLSADELARIEAAAAERARLRDLPQEQRRDRGFER